MKKYDAIIIGQGHTAKKIASELALQKITVGRIDGPGNSDVYFDVHSRISQSPLNTASPLTFPDSIDYLGTSGKFEGPCALKVGQTRTAIPTTRTEDGDALVGGPFPQTHFEASYRERKGLSTIQPLKLRAVCV